MNGMRSVNKRKEDYFKAVYLGKAGQTEKEEQDKYIFQKEGAREKHQSIKDSAGTVLLEPDFADSHTGILL